MSAKVKASAMSFNVVDVFVQVFNDLFSFLDFDHKFMSEVPESSLNSTEKINTLIGVTGDIEGNIMFCFSEKTAEELIKVLTGKREVKEIDFYAKAALTDFFSEFATRFSELTKIANMNDVDSKIKEYTVLTSDPTYISGDGLYGMISKVPSRKIFFKLNGERFGIAYSLAQK